MKINIAASHRFHLLDLAKELSNLGHEVRFYSYVPTNRAIKFGLKKECSYSLFIPMLPFLALIKLSKNAFWAIALKNRALDFYLSWFMKPCDVYIALGTVYEKSFTVAKRKYGATTILEWGSKHIKEQQRILSELPDVVQQPEYFTKRSLLGYENADYIAIASDHVKQSFVDRSFPSGKLLVNPYGVDLSMFNATSLVDDNYAYDLIMVGGWSYRKGCDLLTEVCIRKGLKLLHVGSIVDLDFPDIENLTHVDAVDQSQLINYYSQARMFVLPSREEGLAMVQAQALACGLPIVCSMHTGGRDLKKFLTDKKWIVEMQEYSVDELERCIEVALKYAALQKGFRGYAGDVFREFGWDKYGQRYSNNLKKILHDYK